MSRFDPDPGKPFGQCSSCSLVIETEDDSRRHMQETFEKTETSARSHSIRITNPSRASRIRSRMESLVEDAIERAMENIDRLVQREDITEAEATEALRMWPDFADGWQEYVKDGAA